MLKLILTCALLCLISAAVLGQSHRAGRLSDVINVHVAEFGKTEKSKALRQEITRSLSESKRIKIVAAPHDADAVLDVSVRQGTKNIDWQIATFGDPTPKTGSRVVPAQEIIFRLNSAQSHTLWSSKFDAESFSGANETQAARALANKLSQALLRAIEKDSKRH